MKRPTVNMEAYNASSDLERVLSVPFIYGMIIPVLFLDICMELYHHVAFRLYHIPIVDRSEYIFIDRQSLSELLPLQKISCMYCGYTNGIMAYGATIAAETERYWCAIKHENAKAAKTQPQQEEFLERADFIK